MMSELRKHYKQTVDSVFLHLLAIGNFCELKQALQVIWDNLPQGPINKAVKNFTERLNACMKAGSGHFECFAKLCV